MIISICPLLIVFLRARGIQSGKGAQFRPEQVASQRATQSVRPMAWQWRDQPLVIVNDHRFALN
jgi:hypothetical protein